MKQYTPTYKRLEIEVTTSSLAPMPWPEGTQNFVFSDEVVASMQRLLHKEKSEMEAGTYQFGSLASRLKTLRMPYRDIIVELPMTGPATLQVRPIAHVPEDRQVDTLGAHIRWRLDEDDNVTCAIRAYWKFKNPPHGAPSDVGGDAVTLIASTRPDLQHAQAVGVKSFLRMFDEDPSPLELVSVPSPRFIKSLSEASPEFYNDFINGALGDDKYKELHDFFSLSTHETAEDLPLLLFCTEAMFNCKSGLATKDVDQTKNRDPRGGKLGKKKRKQNAKFTVVYLSDYETVDDNGTVATPVGIRAHHVRGHWKRRATGLYWWSPFIRGKGELKKREAYVVKDSPNESMELQLDKDVRHVPPEVPRGEG